MIHPSKSVQDGKDDRRFVCEETAPDLNKCTYYRTEKEEDRWKLVTHVIRQEKAAPRATAANC